MATSRSHSILKEGKRKERESEGNNHKKFAQSRPRVLPPHYDSSDLLEFDNCTLTRLGPSTTGPRQTRNNQSDSKTGTREPVNAPTEERKRIWSTYGKQNICTRPKVGLEERGEGKRLKVTRLRDVIKGGVGARGGANELIGGGSADKSHSQPIS